MNMSLVTKALALSLVLLAVPMLVIAEQRLATGQDELRMGPLRELSVRGPLNAVAWSADGSQLAALSDFGGRVDIWDARSWAHVGGFDRYGGGYSGNSLAFLPNGNLLTTAPIGRSPDPRFKSLSIFALIEWNPKTGEPVHYIPDQQEVDENSRRELDTFSVSSSGRLVAGISFGDPKNIYLYRVGSPSVIKLALPTIESFAEVARSLSFSPDEESLAVATQAGRILFFELRSGAITRTITAFNSPTHACNALAFSADGAMIACGRYKNFGLEKDDSQSVSIWRLFDLKVVALLSAGEPGISVQGLTWSHSGRTLVVGDDRSVSIWDVSNIDEPKLRNRLLDGTFGLALSPTGKLAATHETRINILVAE